MPGIKDPGVRDYLAVVNWESIQNAVDYIWKSGGYKPDRNTDQWRECFSEACFGFVKGLNSYPTENKDNTASYSTWCISCAKNQLRNWTRRTNRWPGNEKQISAISMDKSKEENIDWEETLLVVSNYADPEQTLIRKQKIQFARKRVAKIKRGLNKMDRIILTKHILALKPLTQVELADHLNVGQSTIHRKIIQLQIQLRLEST